MAIEDIRKMTPEQLDQQLGQLKKEQFNLRFQVASGQIENTGRIRQVRREIARVLTVAEQKRSGSTTGSTAPRIKTAKTA